MCVYFQEQLGAEEIGGIGELIGVKVGDDWRSSVVAWINMNCNNEE